MKMLLMKKQIFICWHLIRLVERSKKQWSRLEADGIKVNHAHIRLIHPFPADEIATLVKKAKKVVVVENNATGQLG